MNVNFYNKIYVQYIRNISKVFYQGFATTKNICRSINKLNEVGVKCKRNFINIFKWCKKHSWIGDKNVIKCY